jgi:hypothetical protein
METPAILNRITQPLGKLLQPSTPEDRRGPQIVFGVQGVYFPRAGRRPWWRDNRARNCRGNHL